MVQHWQWPSPTSLILAQSLAPTLGHHSTNLPTTIGTNVWLLFNQPSSHHWASHWCANVGPSFNQHSSHHWHHCWTIVQPAFQPSLAPMLGHDYTNIPVITGPVMVIYFAANIGIHTNTSSLAMPILAFTLIQWLCHHWHTSSFIGYAVIGSQANSLAVPILGPHLKCWLCNNGNAFKSWLFRHWALRTPGQFNISSPLHKNTGHQ